MRDVKKVPKVLLDESRSYGILPRAVTLWRAAVELQFRWASIIIAFVVGREERDSGGGVI